MNKKKMILTSLASVAILGAGFVASQPTVVRAEESPQAVEKSSSEKEYEKAKAKAAKELKASKEIAEATSQVQNGYVEYLKVQSATNINIKERQKKLAEIDEKINNAQQTLKRSRKSLVKLGQK
ncbi:surface protein A [Streptococcus pneumoniae]|nr:surface protein A [Streptococcus pneumoniae]